MYFVEKYCGHAFQFGIGLNAIAENAFGQNKNARLRRLA